MVASSEPLLAPKRQPQAEKCCLTLGRFCDSVAGMLMVTAAALLFGVVAAFVKATALPTLVMLQCRSMLEWVLGVAVAVAYARQSSAIPVFHQVEAANAAVVANPSELELHHQISKESTNPTSNLIHLLIGPPRLLGWLVLRAFLYWAFLACWWLALTSMPIGDATTIVYCGPIFTATFARIFLKEKIDWSFYPIIVLDFIGLVLVTRPGFLFGAGASSETQDNSYLMGAASSVLAAVIAGLLPVCTRISKECFWTAVNHVSSALSAVVFTPLAFAIWFIFDPSAWDQTIDSLGVLTSGVSLHDESKGVRPLLWLPLLGATLTGFAGLALQTLGYQREEAAKASVMTILEIPFAYLLQAVFFHDELSALGLVGVIFIMSGTLLNLLRQWSKSQARQMEV